MIPQDVAFLPIRKIARHLAARDFTAVELLELYLERIARFNETAKAFITVTGATAREQAARIDRGLAGGATPAPLAGIPFAVKDLIDVAGVRTTAGSRVLADNVAQGNAFLVDRMLDAGAVVLGKTNLHEFAYGATGENPLYGTAVNAYDPGRLAGGSSSGSAAAVAFGLVPAAFGTDTGGSTRAPAALCGLVGLKPTVGRISTSGVIPYCWSLDHIGLIARSVEDAALLLQTVAGHDPQDPGCVDEPNGDYTSRLDDGVSGLRVGVPHNFYFEHCDDEILAAAQAVLTHLEDLGATVVAVDLPSMEHARTVSLTLQMPEALSYHTRYLAERGALYGDDLRAGLALGQCLLAEHYVRARRMLTRYREETSDVLRSVDVLVTPATPTVAPPVGSTSITTAGKAEAVGNALTRYTTFFNMSGHPAVAVPSGLHTTGLPMGVQVVGRYFDEATLMRVAAAIQAGDRFRVPPPRPDHRPRPG